MTCSLMKSMISIFRSYLIIYNTIKLFTNDDRMELESMKIMIPTLGCLIHKPIQYIYIYT